MGKQTDEEMAQPEFAYKKLFSYLNRHCEIPDKMWSYICENSTIQTFAKNEIFINEDRECTNLYFIVSGFCACFYQKDGKEWIMYFIDESHFCLSFHSFFAKKKSLFNIKAMETTQVICIHRDHFDQLSKDYPEFVTIVYKMLENHLVETEERVFHMRSMNAKARVEYFMETKDIQNYMQHVHRYNIASYLNMTPETFAKLLGELNRK